MKKLNVILLALFLTTAFVAVAQDEIYKTVDENGNVVFTNKKPNADAKPLELKPLNQIEGIEINRNTQREAKKSDKTNGNVAQSIEIVSPQDQENVWGTGGEVPVAVKTVQPLNRGEQIEITLAGIKKMGTSVIFTEVPRGEHQITANIVRSGTKIAEAQPITVHMKQHSTLNAPP